VLLGIVMLVVGMIHPVQFMLELRRTRADMKRQGLVHADSRFAVSITFMVSLGLLQLGFAATANMVFKVAVFGWQGWTAGGLGRAVRLGPEILIRQARGEAQQGAKVSLTEGASRGAARVGRRVEGALETGHGGPGGQIAALQRGGGRGRQGRGLPAPGAVDVDVHVVIGAPGADPVGALLDPDPAFLVI
jgi:hypothetical protein